MMKGNYKNYVDGTLFALIFRILLEQIEKAAEEQCGMSGHTPNSRVKCHTRRGMMARVHVATPIGSSSIHPLKSQHQLYPRFSLSQYTSGFIEDTTLQNSCCLFVAMFIVVLDMYIPFLSFMTVISIVPQIHDNRYWLLERDIEPPYLRIW